MASDSADAAPGAGRFLLASDVGGTFTDTVLLDLETGRTWSSKVPSRNRRQEEAVAAGVKDVLVTFRKAVQGGQVIGFAERDMQSHPPLALHHGSTVATNALLERRGAKLGFVTNLSFEDLVAIRRQDRPDLYDLRKTRPEPLVPGQLRLGVPVRRDADGTDLGSERPEVEAAVDAAADTLLAAAVEAVAVGFLHADLHPADERWVAERLRARMPDVHVVASHEVWPEVREVERFETTLIDAYLAPMVAPYLSRLETAVASNARPLGGLGPLRVLDSAGALHPVAEAGRRPAALLLSGPAGGAAAAAGLGRALDHASLVTFDVGGTSTDVALISDGAPERALASTVGGFACRFPSLAVHTVGAGGGSLLWRDAGGHLQVGPQSQGAYPGPACYGRGGEEPTLSDALLLAGRIPAGLPLAGRTLPDQRAAHRAIEPLAHALRTSFESTVVGAIRIAVEQTAGAVHVVTTHRGHDPRGLALYAYGGAGPLLAADLAVALGMREVVVPWQPGTFSARGMAGAPIVDRRVVGCDLRILPDHDAEDQVLTEAWAEAMRGEDVPVGISVRCRAACRYDGQSYELEVVVEPDVRAADLRAALAWQHEKEFGHAHEDRPVEVVRLMVELVQQVVDPGWQIQDDVGTARPERLVAESVVLEQDGDAVVERRARVVWRPELSPGQWLPGPVVLPDPTATTYVPTGWSVSTEPTTRALRLQRTAEEDGR